MPCFFCIAAFVAVAGSITTSVLDRLVDDLAEVADGEVERTVDSESVAVLALTLPAPADPDGARDGVAEGTPVPVEVTAYRDAGRARITVRTHDVTPAQAEAVQDLVAAAAGVEVTERSGEQIQQRVQRAEARREAEAEERRDRDRAPRT